MFKRSWAAIVIQNHIQVNKNSVATFQLFPVQFDHLFLFLKTPVFLHPVPRFGSEFLNFIWAFISCTQSRATAFSSFPKRALLEGWPACTWYRPVWGILKYSLKQPCHILKTWKAMAVFPHHHTGAAFPKCLCVFTFSPRYSTARA